MARVICISNQKGGVGKTTTAINLAASLAAAERKTLLIDLDPQGNAGSGLGIDRSTLTTSVMDALLEQKPLSELIHPTQLKYLDVVPAAADLTGAELELVNVDRRETRLKAALDTVRRSYDYVIIDCPPSLGLLVVNALAAAGSVLIPLQCEYYAMEGLAQLMSTIELAQQGLNPKLSVEGILLTMFDPRANISHEVAKQVKQVFPDLVFDAVVPRNVRLAEAPSFGKPILLYDIKSKGSAAYLELARELMRRERSARKGAR